MISSNKKPSEQCVAAAKKANAILGRIRRNFKCKSPDVIVRLYKCLVRPNLEYCVQAWSPRLRKDAEVLERVQKRATHMIKGINNLSYKDRLYLLKLPSLEERREREIS